MPNSRYIMAIDAGTTGVRCRAVFVDGQEVVVAYREFTQHFPEPGWVEHDAEEIGARSLKPSMKSSPKLVLHSPLASPINERLWSPGIVQLARCMDGPSSGKTVALLRCAKNSRWMATLKLFDQSPGLFLTHISLEQRWHGCSSTEFPFQAISLLQQSTVGFFGN